MLEQYLKEIKTRLEKFGDKEMSLNNFHTYSEEVYDDSCEILIGDDDTTLCLGDNIFYHKHANLIANAPTDLKILIEMVKFYQSRYGLHDNELKMINARISKHRGSE